MPPVEASYTLNGKEVAKVEAEDGVTAVINTPVGKAMGRVTSPEGKKIRLMPPYSLSERMHTNFPGKETREQQGTLGLGETEAVQVYEQKEEDPETVTRSAEYQSEEGRVEIIFKATNPDIV